MLFLAKAALGLGGTIVLAGAYTFHEGVIRVDVDESREGGSHVHMWVPAAAVPMAKVATTALYVCVGARARLCAAGARDREGIEEVSGRRVD